MKIDYTRPCWVLTTCGDMCPDCGEDDVSVSGVTFDESVAKAWEAEGSWQQAQQTWVAS